MYTFPDESKSTPEGKFNSADVAAPPSPEYPNVPVPAMVEILYQIICSGLILLTKGI